jgi:ribonuclease P protein subunit POP4
MVELLNLSPRPEGQLNYSSLKIPNAQGIQGKLVKADFHGSILTSEAKPNLFSRTTKKWNST